MTKHGHRAALAGALLLFLPCPPASSQEKLDPAETAALADLVCESPGYQEHCQNASEAERSAARISLLEWIRAHPRAAGHLLSGFLIDQRFPSSRFRDRLQQYMREEQSRFDRPDSAVRALEKAASESSRLQQNHPVSEDELRSWTERIFERESKKEALSGLDWAAPKGGASFSKIGLRLNPLVFQEIEQRSSRELRNIEARYDKDRAALGKTPLDASRIRSLLDQRGECLRRARRAFTAFTGVLAKRPGAVQSLTPLELNKLNQARGELGRWIASAEFKAREFEALRESAELSSAAVERALAGAPVENDERLAYRRVLAAQADALRSLATRWAALGERLKSPGYARSLEQIKLAAAKTGRLSQVVEDNARLAISLPFEYYNEHARNRLSWLERLWRWLVTTFLPKSRWAQGYRERETEETLLAAAFRSVAQEGL